MSTATIVVEQAGSKIVLRRTVDVWPAEPRRATVMVHESAHAALWGMDPDLLDGLDRQLRQPGAPVTAVRLLASTAGRSLAGDPPVAALLAKRLGVEVVAPDGELVMLAGGEAFSAGPDAGWWSFKRGRRPRRAGPRLPVPAWQADLPRDVAPAVATPGGLWVRAGGPVALSDPAFLVPPGGRPTVVVGAPGEAPPELDLLVRVVSSLRTSWVLTPYGPEPAGVAPVAQRLAERLGRPVHARHGLAYYASDGTPQVTFVDRHRRPTWSPLRIESVYRPDGTEPTALFWVPPAPGLTEAGAGGYWLSDGWLVETIPSGLLVRSVEAAAEPGAGRLATDPDHVNLVVALTGADEPQPAVLDAVVRVADALPPAARSRLRLAASPGVDPGPLSGLAAALRVSLCGLTPTGPEPLGTPCPPVGLPAGPPEHRDAGQPAGTAPADPTLDLASLGRRVQQVPGAVPDLPAATTRPAPVAVDAEGRLRPSGPAWQRVGPGAAGESGADPPAVPEPGPPAPVPPAEAFALATSTVPPALAQPPGEAVPPAVAEAPDGAVPPALVDPPPGRAEPDPVWRAGGPCTPEARHALRRTLGRRYDAAARAVTRLLSEQPGLRGAGSGRDMLAELVAVRTFATVPPAELAPLLDPSFVACLVAGVQRLPALQGTVVRGMPAADLAPGAELAELVPTIAVADPAARVDGALRAVLWSLTGRRLDGLVPADRADEVIFLPGTVFRVLAVADGVLFATEGKRREQDARVLDRLRRAS